MRRALHSYSRIAAFFLSTLTTVAVVPRHVAVAGTNMWTTSGPSDTAIAAIVVEPGSPSTVYAGTGGEGIFKSTDSAATWAPTTAALPNPNVGAMAFSSATPPVLFVGTLGSGVFFTTNGSFFTQVSNGLGTPAFQNVLALAADPTSAMTLYAGLFSGAYKTTNAGGLWEPINSGLVSRFTMDTAAIRSIAVDPISPSTLYAGTSDSGEFKSTNGGAAWGMPGLVGGGNVDVLVVDPQNPETLYAVTTNGVYKSVDGATTWEPRNDGLGTGVRALILDPSTPSTLYAGLFGGGVFKSTDGAEHWVSINFGLTDVNVLALGISSDAPATIYAGTNGGAVFHLQQVTTPTPTATPSATPTLTPTASSTPSATSTTTATTTATATPVATVSSTMTASPTRSATATTTPTTTTNPTISPSPTIDEAARRCRGSVSAASARLLQAEAKAIAACSAKIVRGKLPRDTECREEPKTSAAVQKAQAKLADTIGKACGGSDKTCGTGDSEVPIADLGWSIAMCSEISAGRCATTLSDCSHIAACLKCTTSDVIDTVLSLYFDAIEPTDPKNKSEKRLNKCQGVVTTAATKLLVTRSAAMAKCWERVNIGKTVGLCPGADAKAFTAIAKAEAKLALTICRSCGSGKTCGGAADFAPPAIGFVPTCPNIAPPLGPGCAASVMDLLDMAACLKCTTAHYVDCASFAAVPGLSSPPTECGH